MHTSEPGAQCPPGGGSPPLIQARQRHDRRQLAVRRVDPKEGRMAMRYGARQRSIPGPRLGVSTFVTMAAYQPVAHRSRRLKA